MAGHPGIGRVRPADEDDAAVIAEIHVSSWRAAYAGQLPEQFLAGLSVAEGETAWQLRLSAPPRGCHTLLVEHEAGHPAGFACVGPARDRDAAADTGELQALYVHPDRWRSGLGNLLHDHALDHLRRTGYRTATLWVLRTNEAAQRFYAKAGWEPDGTSKIDFSGDVALAEFRYRKSLADTDP
jgi:GNAT superfamily N-acetyltransferase